MVFTTSIGLSDAKNTIISWFGSTLSSPLLTAIVITVLVLLIVIIIYPASNSACMMDFFKLAVYIFISNTIIMFLYSSVAKSKYESSTQDKEVEEIIGGMRGGMEGIHGVLGHEPVPIKLRNKSDHDATLETLTN